MDIADFLVRRFIQTPQFAQRHTFYPELDSYVDAYRKRIPDLTYFTAEQRAAIRRGERVSTLFAVEILSESERHEDVLDKIDDYFDGGAQLVWYIVPRRREVYAYTAPGQMALYRADQTLSAAPVVPDLQFAVADLFA